jgi:hypothetical protein
LSSRLGRIEIPTVGSGKKVEIKYKKRRECKIEKCIETGIRIAYSIVRYCFTESG